MEEKIVNRFPDYRQVDRFTDIIGPLFSHLRVVSKDDRKMVRSSFTGVLDIVYTQQMKDLMTVKPPKETSTLDELRRHNDSVHHLRLLYKRFLVRATSPDIWQ